jgi:hypothetical protein
VILIRYYTSNLAARLNRDSGSVCACRVADGEISMNEALQRNSRDFKRFYGGEKPKEVFF